MLRERGLVVTYFGEGPADRRERLREAIAAAGPSKVTKEEDERKKREAEEV